jgi:heme exporter protein D
MWTILAWTLLSLLLIVVAYLLLSMWQELRDRATREQRVRQANPAQPGNLADWTVEQWAAMSDEDRAAAIEGWR